MTSESQQKIMKNLKLRILKAAAIAACKIAIAADIKKYPAEWLLHYLQGKGGEKKVPEEIVFQAKKAIARSIYDVDLIEEETHCLYSSTLYEGRGFDGRPDLFYIVGGFSFDICGEKITAKDVYDWHPSDGEYFTSPFGGEKFEWLYKLLDKMFGEDWFSNNNVTGVYGVSNKLWADMAQVGAKEFTSIIDVDKFADPIFNILVDTDKTPEKVSNIMFETYKNAGFIFEKTPAFVVDGYTFYDKYGYEISVECPRKWFYGRHIYERSLNRPTKRSLNRPTRG